MLMTKLNFCIIKRVKLLGYQLGFTELDKMTAGFQRNDLIIVAARPSVGKNGIFIKYCTKT